MLVKPIVSHSNQDLAILVQLANAISAPPPETPPDPEPTFAHPIEATIGVIPTEGNFDSFTALQQIGVAATRTANDAGAFQEQFDDYGVIKAQNPGHLAGNMDFNIDFLQMYAGSGTMSAAAFESWVVYNKWILAEKDDRLSWDLHGEKIYKLWDGKASNFRGYKGWFINEKVPSFSAVAYP